nr:RHS repeat-associated core domain-containing protein [Vibrio intestinalis]
MVSEKRGKNQTIETRYHYDGQHRLIQVELPNGSVANYKYDAFGRRVEKQVVTDSASATTEFVWQGDKLIAESSDSSYQSYIYELGSFKPLALVKGEGVDSQVYYYHLDQIGTPTDITNARGQSVWSVQYRAYGNVLKQHIEQVANPLRFQGQYYDAETGLHYNRHRYYSPNSGRFITADPIGLAGGLNNYQYVVNPTGWVDPLGLASTNSDGECCNNFVYRALTQEQELAAIENGNIAPKGPNANYSIQQHIDDGKLRTQYLSTTKDLKTAQFYAKPSPRHGKPNASKIVKIDLDKVGKENYFDVSKGIDPQTGDKLKAPAYKYSIKDQEVLIKTELRPSVYEIIE